MSVFHSPPPFSESRLITTKGSDNPFLEKQKRMLRRRKKSESDVQKKKEKEW